MLEVDPHDRHGRGGARYRLRIDGELEWTCERPWTLYEATVGDDGVAAGFAYTAGRRDVSEQNEFVVVLLDADGTLRTEQRFPRRRVARLAAEPIGRGVFLQPDLGRFVVRVDRFVDVTRNGEEWWTFPLAGGARSAVSAIGSDRFYDQLDAVVAVPGTPLVLARSDWQPETRLRLIDADLREVWSTRLHAEPLERAAPDRAALSRWLERDGAIDAGPEPGGFSVVRADGERVSYAVVRDESSASGWRVRDGGRSSVRLPSAPAAGPMPTRFALTEIAEVGLGRDAPPPRVAIRDVVA